MSHTSEQSLQQLAKSLAKIRIKLKNVEIDFEGTEDYIRNDLPNLFELICIYASTFDDTESEFEEAGDRLLSKLSDRKSNLDFFQLINCSHFSKFSIQREYEVSKSSQGAGFLTCFHTGLYKASYNSRAISTNPA